MGRARHTETVRAFIALPLSLPLVEALKALQQRLQMRLDSDAVRWVRPDQMHVTFQFLGDISAATVGELVGALERASAGQKPLALRAEQLGCFPDYRKPRVIWVGIQGEVDQLRAWQRRIERETAGLVAERKDRQFYPHLTLGRVKKVEAPQARRVGKGVEEFQIGPLGNWTAQQVDLMQSVVSAQGPTYFKLAEVPLSP